MLKCITIGNVVNHIVENSLPINDNLDWFSTGSSNGHSPVLNLSKSGGLDQGSTGDQSDHSEVHSPPPSIHDEEDNLSDDNVSDVDEREEKEDGKLFNAHLMYLFPSLFLGIPFSSGLDIKTF